MRPLLIIVVLACASAQLHGQTGKEATDAVSQDADDAPVANPARPTVSTPAALPPAGYLQFETGTLNAWTSPGVLFQTSLNEVAKIALTKRFEFLASLEPYAHTRSGGMPSNDAGGVSLGVQAVIFPGEGATPTIAASYFRSVYDGTAPDLDIGSSKNSVLLLASADVKKLHYDANVFFNEVNSDPVRRAQFGQSLSISHPITSRLGLAGEIWHFSQPFIRGNAVGNLWAVSYNASKILVFDAGFDHGFTSSSTHWEVFAGFTYLLPHKIIRR